MGQLTRISDAARLIQDAFPDIVSANVPLKSLSRWKIGGHADCIVEPQNVQQLQHVRAFLSDHHIPNVTIGETSNLLFSDGGLRAAVVRLGNGFNYVNIEGTNVSAGGATWVPMLARAVMKASLRGLEHTSGIPGTVGGLVYMNGGSQRRGIGDCITSVTSVDPTGGVLRRSQTECNFSYRHSVFHNLNEVIIDTQMELNAGERSIIRKEMLSILKSRRRRFPRKLPNCGSVFVSNPAMYEQYGPPGAVIERLGFKGHSIGNAQISPDHANFINNLGNATTADVLALINLVRQTVKDETGYLLQVEAQYVSESGQLEEI